MTDYSYSRQSIADHKFAVCFINAAWGLTIPPLIVQT